MSNLERRYDLQVYGGDFTRENIANIELVEVYILPRIADHGSCADTVACVIKTLIAFVLSLYFGFDLFITHRDSHLADDDVLLLWEFEGDVDRFSSWFFSFLLWLSSCV